MSSRDSDFHIVWVEIGRKVPRYAKRAISYHNKSYPQPKKTLITDQVIHKPPVRLSLVDEIPRSKYTDEFLRLKKSWSHGQEYFWHGTTFRFFQLYDLMTYEKLENVIHLETDSLLLGDRVFDYLFSLGGYDLGFPLQASGIGCASILWLRNSTALEPLLELILKKWEVEDVNDMDLLGEFSSYERVKIFPTWPQGSIQSELIFDAQSIGSFYCGTHARNARLPFSLRGNVDSRSGSIMSRLSDVNLNWSIGVKKRRVQIRLYTDGLEGELGNIHIHSKTIPRSMPRLVRILKRGFNSSQNNMWKMGTFDFRVLLERLISVLARRIIRSKKFVERNYH